MSLEELIARRAGANVEAVGDAPPAPGVRESASIDTPKPVSEPDEKGEMDGGSVVPGGLRELGLPVNDPAKRASDESSSIQPEGEGIPREDTEPWGVAHSVTPSGLSLYYQAGPERLYTVNGKEVPSVTTVLDILQKGGLPYWGNKVGAEGILELVQRGLLVWVDG